MRVAVYKNLTRGCWSIAEVNAAGNRGKLIGHADSIALSDCRMVVKESRRIAICANRNREVHAWIVGTICDIPASETLRELTYNPYRSDSFHTQDGQPVIAADTVIFTDKAYLT